MKFFLPYIKLILMMKHQKESISKKNFKEILDAIASNRVEFKAEGKGDNSYKEMYRKLLREKYLK